MMRNAKRAASLLLALVLVLGLLSACGDGGQTDATPTPAPETGFAYVPTYQPLDAEFSYISRSVYANGRLYFLADIQDGEETYTSPVYDERGNPVVDESGEPVMEEYTYPSIRSGMFSMDISSTEVQELTAYTPPALEEGQEGGAYVQGLAVDDAGHIWTLEQTYVYHYDLPADFDPQTGNRWEYMTEEQFYRLRKLGADGAELLCVDLSELQNPESDYFYINYFNIDAEGRLYLGDSDANIHVLDGEGVKLFTIANDGQSWLNGLSRTRDGEIAVLTYDRTDGASGLRLVDAEKKALGEAVSAPYNAYNLLPGSGEYDFYYSNGTGLYGFSIDDAEAEKVLTWINCDVDNYNLGVIVPLEDGTILCTTNDYSGDSSKTELITLKLTPLSEIPKKTTLSYACMWLDYDIRAQILKFNRSNTEYRIEVQNYSEYNTEKDFTAGLTRLTAEILTGSVPDILDTNNLPIDQYAAKGYLEDLWPYIEADSEIGGREGLVQPLFDAVSLDGKLYQAVSGFSIFSVMGASAIVGDEPGWTVEEATAALRQMPEGCEYFSIGTTRDSMLQQMCYMGMDSFVDWSSGQCSFDSAEFVQLLEFAALFPAEFDWNSFEWGPDSDDYARIMSGQQMLSQMFLNDFSNYQLAAQVFGGETTFIGFPGGVGNGAAFQIQGGLAMSSRCQDKDGAWSFIRTLLTEEYQTTSGLWTFPTNQKAFDLKLKQAMTPDYYTDYETGEQIESPKNSYWISEDLRFEVFAMTQEEADEILSLIENTTRVYSYDESIFSIILEEAASFFAGQKSAQDTANMIQNRVGIYVSEQS